MQVIIADSAQEVARLGADQLTGLLRTRPNAVLGLATGNTPIALYEELVRRYRSGNLSFAGARSFNLDEYVGLAPEHPQSYRYFMNQYLFSQIDIALEHTHVPDGMADPQTAGEVYEAQIEAAGGIDLQVLGIGRNGHIGFNEPSSSLGSGTRIKTLAPQTLVDNSRFFGADEFQPSLAITMGIGTILRSRKTLLLATGDAKADAVQAMVEGPVTASCPASALQLHPCAVVIVDRAAAARLEHCEYYQRVREETDQLKGR
ncbi:glucosamine-6-phosphate deaminase [Marinobacterium sedimentorum]|uniref:glucosamine-6-phosphate deaminase n=1 Tax=Marinobacterium sedimentorum TaxID=2927804 RepID=UPI0020C6927C|nr:glucosamine-6-phosphate deaminase [Marinobacterium sedimentorum]MCP8690174.1 glucosamine-6-phosphate deaminase [Marinobacterium sedimentorum]